MPKQLSLFPEGELKEEIFASERRCEADVPRKGEK